MKRKIKLSVILLTIIGVTVTFSCHKVDTNKTKTELITSRPWKRIAFISNPAYDWNADGTFDTNLLNTMFPCEKDNLDIYKTNGIIETNEGPTKCNSTDPQSWTVSWTFTDNETKLLFDGTDNYTLVELTQTVLKYQSTFVENGVTYTHIETYGH